MMITKTEESFERVSNNIYESGHKYINTVSSTSQVEFRSIEGEWEKNKKKKKNQKGAKR